MLRKTLLGTVVLLVAVRTASAQSTLDPGTLYKQASPAVVLIEALGSDGKVASTGSGLLVSTDGKLLTNYHVIAHAKQATVRLANGDAYDLVEVIAVDKRKDIAFLKIAAVDMPVVKLGRSNSVEVGQTVYSIGSPLGLQNTLSQGLVSGVREMDGYRLFQISAPISHGSSGGPIFNLNGEAIGIAVLTIEGGQNLNFAIPIDYARGMLGMSQTQPLESIYEPAPPPEPTPAPKPDATKVPTSITTTAIPEEMRRGSLDFLINRMGIWHLDDARQLMGEPVRERAFLVAGSRKAEGVIYAFPDPTGVVREFELHFPYSTGILSDVWAYPKAGVVHLKDFEQLWGRKYRVTKNPNGSHFYAYADRRINILVDKDGNVVSVSSYLP
jgi:Trypsin-like peptidase domain